MAAFRQRRCLQAGVTLVEMLATVAVLAVAASLAVPSASSVSSFAVDAVAGETARAIRFAQREAVRTGAWHRVDFDTAAQSLRVYRLTTSGLVSEDTSAPVLHPVDKRVYQIRVGGGDARAGIASAEFTYDAGAKTTYISFGPDGTPADIHGWFVKDIDPLKSDGNVVITHGKTRRVVVVEPDTGRVTF